MNNIVYPNPDPMLRYISNEEAPSSFWDLPQQERSKRARFHIIVRCAGSDPILSWMWTMDMRPVGQQFVNEVMADKAAVAQERGQSPDEWLMDAIRADGGWISGGT